MARESSASRELRARLDPSVLRRNASQGFETPGYPGIFVLAAGPPQVTDSILE
jgi:hypothetical protein